MTPPNPFLKRLEELKAARLAATPDKMSWGYLTDHYAINKPIVFSKDNKERFAETQTTYDAEFISLSANSILSLIEACEAMYEALEELKIATEYRPSYGSFRRKDGVFVGFEGHAFMAQAKATEILLGKDGGGT